MLVAAPSVLKTAATLESLALGSRNVHAVEVLLVDGKLSLSSRKSYRGLHDVLAH